MRKLMTSFRMTAMVLLLLSVSAIVQAQTGTSIQPDVLTQVSTPTLLDSTTQTAIVTPIDSLVKADSLTLFESIYGDSILQMHIKTNLRQIIKKKAKKEKHTGVLTYKDANGVEREWNIKIRARGNMRNKICFLPPLKLNFKKAELRAAGIQGMYDDLKLVVHCKSGKNYENYVLREYLAYKLYNELTDNSFRVQLVKLTLEDIEEKQKPIEIYAFLIEDVEEVAERMNGRVVVSKFFNHENIHPSTYDKMCVFQFMIGNLDWHILSNHNTKLLTNRALKSVVSIPYDFDYAALVGTPYATPHAKLPVENIQERFFLGLCRGEGMYEPTLQFFRDKKNPFSLFVETLPY